MVFSSLLFLFRFLPLMLLAYFAVPKRLRNGVLFIGSLIFYGWGEPVYVSLLLFSTVVDFTHGKAIGRFLEQGKKKAAKGMVASSVIINLGLLGFFKYADFLLGTVNGVLGAEVPLLNLALPIGISFYTFQTMSYTIDVYRGKTEVQDNIIHFGAYVSMFPQLIAGPVVRYSTIARELENRRETYDQFAKGAGCFTVGLGKKVLLANVMGQLWDQIQGIPEVDRSVALMWLGILAYGMQIYFDFSGYSDMAVGLGHMFGFHFPENFRYPYRAKSITDFWSRWHISLGTWFKEYVYIPLGGNRNGRGRQVRNILLVWLLTGIWHGAGWNFVLWGIYFGLLLLLEKFLLKRYLENASAWLQHAYAMVLVFLGWVLFAHEDMAAGMAYYQQMFGLGGLAWVNRRTLYLLVSYLPVFAMAVAGSGSWPRAAAEQGLEWLERTGRNRASLALRLGGMAAVLLLVTAYLVDASYNPFLYFRF